MNKSLDVFQHHCLCKLDHCLSSSFAYPWLCVSKVRVVPCGYRSSMTSCWRPHSPSLPSSSHQTPLCPATWTTCPCWHLAWFTMQPERGRWSFLAGSSVEGVAVESGWGHERSDADYMYLYGVQLGVCVAEEQLPTISPLSSSENPGKSCLVYDPEGCHPGYTRLRVADRRALLAHRCVDHSCILECEGRHWLLSAPLRESLLRDINQTRDPAYPAIYTSGPAGQVLGGLADVVPTLVANGPHPAIMKYITRLDSSEWPSQDQRQEIQQLPMNFVLVGHKYSPRKDQEFRISFSASELVLIRTLPLFIKQGYIAFKFVTKYHLKINRTQKETDDGRSKIGSFYFKSSLLNYLEKTPFSKIKSPFNLMIDLCRNFIDCLKRRELPHHFLPECNLLDTVEHGERQIALKSLKYILSDPSLLFSNAPQYPEKSMAAFVWNIW